MKQMLHRPIYGGVFGHGVYSLATMPTISNGLHAVRWLVIEPRRGTVLSVADEKLAAISSARRLLAGLSPPDAANDARWEQAALWADLPIDRPPRVRPVSRRRREVFARSEGRCHYCGTALTLDGRWHVEHMVPRALDGEDSAPNLVAACVPCNLAKRDRTALEWVVSRDEGKHVHDR
ncbi:MAG TPA: HNH endonuclease [Burkholderiaceae bacterium]